MRGTNGPVRETNGPSTLWATWITIEVRKIIRCKCNCVFDFRKASCPYKVLPAILGPEMAAPILWAPRKIAFFLQGNLHAHKIPRFIGGGVFGFFWGGGGSADFIFMGARTFLIIHPK